MGIKKLLGPPLSPPIIMESREIMYSTSNTLTYCHGIKTILCKASRTALGLD